MPCPRVPLVRLRFVFISPYTTALRFTSVRLEGVHSAMKKIRDWFYIDSVLPRPLRYFAAVFPFVLLAAIYLIAADIRHRENPKDKIIPTLSEMAQAVNEIAFTEDKRSGEYLMWRDTVVSLRRFSIGLGLSAITALFVGLNIGLVPIVQAFFRPFVTFLSIIPPLAVLPILFIAFGVDEFSKIMLIFIGTAPTMVKDISITASQIPIEQKIKAMTLGASQLGVIYRIALPQIMPRLLDMVRLSIITAWLFLIAAEALAATEGLGYRIFLVRRYLAMNIIIPYVFWIAILGFLMDAAVRWIMAWRYSWYVETK